MKTKLIVLCSIGLLMAACQSKDKKLVVESEKTGLAESVKTVDQDSLAFIKAWDQFCDRLSVCDTQGAKSMLSFPLKTRGVLDTDPYFSYTEKDCMKPIFKFFEQQLDARPCDKDFAEKLKKYRAGDLYPNCFGGTARIGDAVFTKIHGEWKLNFLYVDTAEDTRVYR